MRQSMRPQLKLVVCLHDILPKTKESLKQFWHAAIRKSIVIGDLHRERPREIMGKTIGGK